MRLLGRLFVVGAFVFVALQLMRPGIPSGPATAQLQVSPGVHQILVKHCYSCHSDQRRLSWFDQIVPGYWLVRHDILAAREHLNFSTLASKPAALQKATLYEAVNMIQLRAMPLPVFLKLHPEAKVTPEELAELKAYLAPWAPAPQAVPASLSVNSPAPALLATVQPEFNGVDFDSTFGSWKPLSVTERGDNSTFRFILGNEVAIQAAQTGNISPWPDGARFAKIAWQRQSGADGLIFPGKFVQVELMLKNAREYKDTEGWGWGRWRGAELKPYGDDARFVNECTSCHQPLRGDDYVYTLPISTATVSGHEVVNRAAAALPASLPYQPLSWGAITMYVDPGARTISTLYGNPAAMLNLHPRIAKPPAYSEGSVLALVTWAQRDDPHWFGARIPDVPRSVEFVQVATGGQHPGYRRFAGTQLTEESGATNAAGERTNFLLALPPAWLP